MAKFIDRKGEVNRAKNGMLMTIIRYGNSSDIDIEFEDGTIAYSKSYDAFKKGKIDNKKSELTDSQRYVMDLILGIINTKLSIILKMRLIIITLTM